MKNILLALIIAGLATSANATWWGNNDPTNENDNRNTNINTAVGGNAHAGALAGANNRTNVDVSNRNHNSNRNANHQGQFQGQGQQQRNVIRDSGNSSSVSGSRSVSDQSQSSVNNNSTGDQANSQVNGQNVTFNESEGVRYSGSYTVKSTPGVSLATPAATAPCYVSQGVSGAGVGFGFGVNVNVYDDECEVRETVRLAQADGDANVRALASQVLASRLTSYLPEQEATADNFNPSSSRTIASETWGNDRDSVTGLPSY